MAKLEGRIKVGRRGRQLWQGLRTGCASLTFYIFLLVPVREVASSATYGSDGTPEALPLWESWNEIPGA